MGCAVRTLRYNSRDQNHSFIITLETAIISLDLNCMHSLSYLEILCTLYLISIDQDLCNKSNVQLAGRHIQPGRP